MSIVTGNLKEHKRLLSSIFLSIHGTHLHFNGHFPDDPGLAGSSSVFTCRMPFLSPNQQCQSSKGNTKHWTQPDLILSLSTTRVLAERALFPLRQFSDASTSTP